MCGKLGSEGILLSQCSIDAFVRLKKKGPSRHVGTDVIQLDVEGFAPWGKKLGNSLNLRPYILCELILDFKAARKTSGHNTMTKKQLTGITLVFDHAEAL
jgi:hypothetical protein